MKNRLLRYGPVIVWMLLMFFMSSRSDLPATGAQGVDFASKKFAHLIEYFILNLLWFRAVEESSPAKATIYSLMFAFTDEIHQLFIPGRTGKLQDVGIDFTAIAASSLLILKFPIWKNLLFQTPVKKLKK